MKSTIFALSLLALLTGCSDNKEEQAQTAPKEAAAGGIEVSKNKDAYKTKVEEKEINGDRTFYYQETKKAEERSTVDANVLARSPYEQVEIELLVQRLSKEFIVKCSACHNDYANGIIGPSLLDKSADFIYSTIAAYKTGEKENVLMNSLVKQMSDEKIKELANEIAAFNEEIRELRKR